MCVCKCVRMCVCVCVCVYIVLCIPLDPSTHSYEVTSTKFSRTLPKELLLSLWSALFLGFGITFLLLWVGIYV